VPSNCAMRPWRPAAAAVAASTTPYSLAVACLLPAVRDILGSRTLTENTIYGRFVDLVDIVTFRWIHIRGMTMAPPRLYALACDFSGAIHLLSVLT